jgi:Sulfotransferase family
MSVPGPVAVGGLGGSGTRVVATVFRALDYDIGSDLNVALDNLTFTLIFKRPKRFRYSGTFVDPDDPYVRQSASVFRRVMRGEKKTTSDVRYLAGAAADMALHGHDHLGSGRGVWALQRVARLRRRTGRHPSPPRWGWKEPNSYVFLPALFSTFEGLKYVHVVRDGLDMAYSNNLAQVHNWGGLFGVEAVGADRVGAQLTFWARANTAVAAYLASRQNGEHAIVRYEDLTSRPREAFPALLDELGLEEDAERARRLVELGTVAPSASVGRHRGHDVEKLLGGAGPEVQLALEQFGYGRQ